MLHAQFGFPGIPDIPGRDIDVEDIVAGLASLALGVDDEPVLTTSLADAKTEVPFLDDFNPAFFRMERLERGPNGGFIPHPGYWRMDVQSYCLHAGTHGPGHGSGYLYAPLKGSRASVIRNIIRNTRFHPDIPQSDVQSLIWGILARTKISDMSPNLLSAANILLTAEEISELNKGSLDIVPAQHWNLVFDNLGVSSDFRRILEAEAGIRSHLTGGSYAYHELERIAVLTGTPPAMEGDRYVPAKRWSWHPQGYFIRYEPHGYSRTTVEISIPHFFHIEWDDLGRIVMIDDQVGRRLEIEYDDDIAPVHYDRPRSSAYAFKSITYHHEPELYRNIERHDVWSDTGWTLTGYSDKALASGGSNVRFANSNDRLAWARNHWNEVSVLCQGSIAIPVVFKIGLLANAVQEITGDSGSLVVEFLKEAWQDKLLWAMHVNQSSEILLARNMHKSGEGSEMEFEPIDLSGDDEFEEIDLSGDDDNGGDGDEGGGSGDRGGSEEGDNDGSATPGEQGRQRLGISSSDASDSDNNDDDEEPGEPYEKPGPDDEGYDDYTDGWYQGYLDGWKDAGKGFQNDLGIPPLKNRDFVNGYCEGYTAGNADGWSVFGDG